MRTYFERRHLVLGYRHFGAAREQQHIKPVAACAGGVGGFYSAAYEYSDSDYYPDTDGHSDGNNYANIDYHADSDTNTTDLYECVDWGV